MLRVAVCAMILVTMTSCGTTSMPAGLSAEGSTADGVELPTPTVAREDGFLVVRGKANTAGDADGRVDIEFVKDNQIIDMLTTRLAGKPGQERSYEVVYNYSPPAGTAVRVRYVSAPNAILEDSSGIVFESGTAGVETYNVNRAQTPVQAVQRPQLQPRQARGANTYGGMTGR